MSVINLDHLTKIEGHAKLRIKIHKGEVEQVKLQIFEGSRYFEGMLRDKKYNDLAPISSRICGICSPVHTITSLTAIEKGFGIEITEQTNILRELALIGGLIQSHVLHLYFLALPDYLGYESALSMAKDKKKEIMQALAIKRAGNEMVSTIGGRDIHPVAAVLGGFSRIPSQESMQSIYEKLKAVRASAMKTIELFYDLELPEFERKKDLFSLTGDTYFASHEKINCLGQQCIPVSTYEAHFKEYFKEGSTAEFAVESTGKTYMVGSAARVANNGNLLSEDTSKYVNFINKNKYNPFINNLAQAVELYEAVKCGMDILETFKVRDEIPVRYLPRKCVGIGASEAPRGIVFHKYEINEKGYCTASNITTPTTQNLQNIEENIAAFLPQVLHLPQEKIILEVEKLIRAYDPCISCSTHFLDVVWE